MGSYIYKVTKNRVKLADGREANVAVYAYKPGYSPGCAGVHKRTGCERADDAAFRGEFSGLIVEGRKDPQSGNIEVDIASPVFEEDHGSYNDDWMADFGKRLEGPGAAIVRASYPCRLVRHREVPRGDTIWNGMRWDRIEKVKERKVNGRGKIAHDSWVFMIASEMFTRPRDIN